MDDEACPDQTAEAEQNSQTILGVVGSSVKTALNWAKSAVSKRTS
ncbi:hypothetical protein [Mesorhizobium dulcispinae]|nr:hypothetical protein [Mesorhizobium sp. VK23D]MDX8522803.1 hypothetical protein [Mesorhizobium sp. VK23D]